MCLAAFQQLILSTKQKACNNLFPLFHNQYTYAFIFPKASAWQVFLVIYVYKMWFQIKSKVVLNGYTGSTS